ncbi:MAG TPA: phosphodiester glycosidase family protein [Acidimicrobiia bacterium]|nr:phosphodiester glycosidase family protein [Acidimicrobiia bacterium]
MPDRTPEPPEGERQRYTLPNEYGPARPPLGNDDDLYDDDTPAVTLHERDAPTTVGTAGSAATAAVAPVAPVAPVAATMPVTANGQSEGARPRPPTTEQPLSRRELREQRERAQAAEKTTKTTRPPRSKRAKWIRRGIAIAVVLLLVPVAVSYVNYLQRPGSDTLSVRTVEWIRDHGGNGIVNTVERWWYTNNPPPTGGKPSAIKVQDTVTDTTTKADTAPPTYPQIQRIPPPIARVATPAPVVEPNEGVWQPTGRLVSGQPAVYTTYVRPDAAHTSYYTGLMWLDTKLLRANYVIGTEQPGGGPNPWGSEIPESQRDIAIASFNSGFKMDSANGGAYLDGQEIVPLRGDAASLVINQDGSANVGVWGRDFAMSPDIKAVRQNLALIVDNGQLNPALQENDTSLWGATLGNNVFVWRSGVGVTADGALVYAGGPAMSIVSLARTLQAAGAVRAMEMDINTDWVSAFTYVPQDPNTFNSPIVGSKLLDGMTHDGSQYLQQSSRDFFAFTADAKVVAPLPTTTTTPPTTTRPKKK